MALPDPHPGLVISYSYLWHEEYRQGQIEGVKNRPCAVVLGQYPIKLNRGGSF